MNIHDIPKDIRDFIVSLGRADWGQTDALDAHEHGLHVANSVRLTAARFDQFENQHMHGVYLEGTGTIVCHTGTSPNSPKSARALTGLWNWIHDLSVELQRDCTMCDGKGTKDHASLAIEPCDHARAQATPFPVDDVVELVTAARQMLWPNWPGFTGDEGRLDQALQPFTDRVPA